LLVASETRNVSDRVEDPLALVGLHVIARQAVTPTRQLIRGAHPPTDSRSTRPHYNPSKGNASHRARGAVRQNPTRAKVRREGQYPRHGRHTRLVSGQLPRMIRPPRPPGYAPNISHRPCPRSAPTTRRGRSCHDRYTPAGEPPHGASRNSSQAQGPRLPVRRRPGHLDPAA